MDISAQLAEIASYGGFFALTVGPDQGSGAQAWRPVWRCYADGYADLVDATARYYGTPDLRIGASLVHLAHASRLWSPVLACALAHRVLPRLDELQRAADGARLRLPEPVGDPVGDDPAGELYRAVVERHLHPLAAGLRVKLAPALLAGNVASALFGAARALCAARPDLRRRIAATTGDLLGTGILAGSGVSTGAHLGFRRRSCCLFYRLPGQSVCGDCVFDRPPGRR
ncbi:iron reductase [Mycobacterium sp. E2462]|uniref:(2Fe-2S)-binding protein n=1 Tax=unclassified Mycobacterium TaxID=2642494 RepID=UPI0008020D08|nr:MULTISPECIES: (2Fe-2S)-binding protein [unclassified Mycobacterium]OBG72428.1 iron reductase [Mycobacterium sp. E1214]OBH22561.1 iron reductase [Mycobacterium sp. E1319]OBI02816.1 iron reductase [Mycobacterium sp. E2462]